jgi:hypothetical protein
VGDAGARGWQNTSLLPTTAHTYTPQLHQLTAYPHTEAPATATAKSRNKVPAACQCPRRIWAARATLAQAPILCAQCGAHFTANDDTNNEN